ncbi:MAG: hypothetical protein IJF59_05235, partial [Clostridia bacterium]|nr:hypothetical protein [Clostridia bacterium]
MGWEDAVTISSAKIYQYTSDLSLYTPTTEPQVYHNARHEPQTGVYYGIPADSATRAELPGESMMLLYYNLGNETDLSWHRHIIEESADKDLLVEFALNLPGEGSQVAGFASYQKEVQQVIDLMASMPNTRFLLRFAAEFNVWSDLPDPAQYISVFRQVATAARRHPNIAMVWSPNDASSWGVNLADYYPGDEYVDWVGVSLYVKKYFQGNPDANDYDEIVFRTGDSANPVKTLEEIVSLYGDRKPIMLSESGASHTCRTAGESTADFALKALPQLYLNLPMVYPQVKLIAHFDKVMPAESEDYALTTSAQVKQLYKELTASPAFIQSNGSAAPVTHQKLTDGYVAAGNTLTVSAYTHLFKADSVTVDYYVDDALLASSSQLPYTVTLDLSGLAAGSHVVKAVATGSTGSVVETSFTMTAGTAAPVEPPAPEPPAAPVFDDVPAGEYFAKPVAWAVKNAITQGTGATTFSPADT